MKNNSGIFEDYVVKENKKKFSKEKASFLSHISHGIRTPLNSIMGFSKLLASRNKINSKQREYIQGILNGSNLLLQFVDNIMDLSQFEADNYALRVIKTDINKVLWDFSEEFYNQRVENNDTNINLMLVWDGDVNHFDVETDIILLKKSLIRIINLVIMKYPIVEFELGYRKIDNDWLYLFIRPALEKLTEDDLLETQQIYSAEESDSFDYFNFTVLKKSVNMLGGEVIIDPKSQEFAIKIPLKYRVNKELLK